MTASELRIGNWVNKLSEGNIKVDLTILSEISLNNEKFRPVNLNERLLSRIPEFKQCSWKKDFRLDLRYDNSQFHIIKYEGRFIFRGLGMSIVFVDTLHHLQNLVFFSTNKELIINF